MNVSLKNFLLNILLGVITISLIVGMVAGLIHAWNYPFHTPEYKAGYQAGYTEKNETKYQAACNLTNTPFVECTTGQYRYASGYENGYHQKQNDLKWSEEQNNTNNSLKILGI